MQVTMVTVISINLQFWQNACKNSITTTVLFMYSYMKWLTRKDMLVAVLGLALTSFPLLLAIKVLALLLLQLL